MNQNLAKTLIEKHFPDLKINKIEKIGEGTGNVAYTINDDLIFRFPKEPRNQKQLEQEIILQPILEKYSSLAYPKFEYLPPDHSFVGYVKLEGEPLINRSNIYTTWEQFSNKISHFLSQLHDIPKNEITSLNLLTENKSFSEWQSEAGSYYEKTKSLIPQKYYSAIETFLNEKIDEQSEEKVLCHNDLGIEHIMINDNEITGIIDWGGVAIADPACDFARIYRDLGPDLLDMLIAKYQTTQQNIDDLRTRAIFYGKCLVFQDLYCGIKENIYLQKSLIALDWMFTE